MQLDGFILKVEMTDPERPRYLAGNRANGVRLVRFPEVYPNQRDAADVVVVFLNEARDALEENDLWTKDNEPVVTIKPASISF